MRRRSWFREVLKVAAAAVLLGVPICETHREVSLGAQRTDGSLIAIQAAHPGDAVHIEASAVEVGASCAACELALQPADEFGPTGVATSLPAAANTTLDPSIEFAEATLSSASVRGPPSATT